LVEREQAFARFKCEQELVRLDEVLTRLDEGDENIVLDLESFDTCEILAPLRFLSENRIMNIDALIDAAKSGQTSVVKMLIARVNPSAKDNYAIRMASEYGHTGVVKVLLADTRVNPSAFANYAIRYASENGHTEVVKMLLPRINPSEDFKYTICDASQTVTWMWLRCYLQTLV